jgi:hypothetical protein
MRTSYIRTYTHTHTHSFFRLHRATVFSWIMDMMHALEFLHNRDPVIMHRDLKAGAKITQIVSQSLCKCETKV